MPQPGHVLCLGDALVDLICPRVIRDLSEADRFVPHFGGVVANVAVVAARAGVRVALAGAAGADAWGGWLRRRLEEEGVEASHFALVDGVQTSVAFVAVDESGEPRYTLYGEPLEGVAHALPEPALEPALDGISSVFLSSNTLPGQAERQVTMQVREQALARGLPVIFDANVRLHRWRSRADAAASANACVPGALLVRCTAAEAELMTGEDDVERAALALVKAGARLVVVTLGSRGAILRGELRSQVPGVPVDVVSTLGAGDVLSGLLLARLAQSGFYPAAVAAALPEAVARAARACTRWGALD